MKSDFLSFLTETQSLIDWSPGISGPELMYIVLSHESCDLDSVVSTLAIAYFRYKNRGQLDHRFLPVLNMLRRDYPSKSEVRFLLEKHNMTSECHLIFRDDVPESLLLRCRFILVNHHESPFNYCVEEIYDYRQFQCETTTQLPNYCQRIIQPMSSCAALITERFSNAMYNNAKVQSPLIFDMLHAAILLQNRNFAEIPDTTLTDVGDYQMLQYLEQNLGELRPDQRTTLYDALVDALFDLSDLTLPQILRREFKLLRATNGLRMIRIAQCCFPMSITRFISYEFAQLALQEFGAEHDCDYIMLLGNSIHPNGGLGIKELALIPMDSSRDVEGRRIFDHIIINLNETISPLLCLEPHHNLDFMQGAYFFLNVWNIGFYDILHLMQRILYEWVSEENCTPN